MLSVTDKQIAKQSVRGSTMGSVLQAIQYGDWPKVVHKELKPFCRRCTELTVNNGCLLWRHRVVIPIKLKESLLLELHSNHIGVNMM